MIQMYKYIKVVKDTHNKIILLIAGMRATLKWTLYCAVLINIIR